MRCFKKGMLAVQAKAMACYSGTQGTANVKITIGSSGIATKVVVSGQFAGTPVAVCLTNAINNARFRPWDGPPSTYSYSYLLTD